MRKSEQKQHLLKLQMLKARLSGEVMHLSDEAFEKSAGDSTQPTHIAELGSVTHEQDIMIRMLQCEESVLGEINDAIDRVQAGTFGRCERCTKPIPKPRLNAIPYARYCVKCAKDVELED